MSNIPSPDPRTWTLLIGDLYGFATPEERAELQQWLEADPAHAELRESMRRGWMKHGVLPENPAEDFGEDRMWERLARLTRDSDPVVLPMRPRPVPARRAAGRSGIGWLRWAAGIVLAVGGTALWHYGDRAPDGRFETHGTAAGERVTVGLADGSEVVLGPESELRVSSRFGRSSREVELQGIAQFTVERDAQRPFRVHADRAVTQVLGTRFVVRAYPDEGKVDVAVADGRVAVRAKVTPGDEPMVLFGGQHARMEATGALHRVEGENLDALLGWPEGRLVFRDTPVGTVLRDIERWYGVDLRAEDPALTERRVTTSFQNEPLGEVLGMLAVVLDVRVERHGQTVTLTPNR